MLHVFDRSCNLLSEDGRLISLVTQEIGDGPFNLVLPPTGFSHLVSGESEVRRQNGKWRVGGLMLDLSRAALWDPRPDWDMLRQERDKVRGWIPLLIKLLRSAAPMGGLVELICSADPPPIYEHQALRPARGSIDKLIKGLRRKDADQCETAACELAGCGVGLTPEGDDFLLGCLLAVRILYEKDQAHLIAGSIAEAAARRTTLLSAAWLRAAAIGKCAAPWHALFQGLVCDKAETIETAARAIMRQGHTSGSAALAGFISVLQSIS